MEAPFSATQKIISAEVCGLDAPLIEVEVQASNGLPRMDIVGLAEACVRESKQRVRAAIVSSGWEFPDHKITVNLAPASVKKIGTGLDLAIALGVLLTQESPSVRSGKGLAQTLVMGELSLSGSLRSMSGVLNIATTARKRGFRNLILPMGNLAEAALVSGISLFPARTLREVYDHFMGQSALSPIPTEQVVFAKPSEKRWEGVDLKTIKGQSLAKQALMVAAAGGHNLLLTGPPGTGKTLLARCLPSLLPDLVDSRALETTRIYSCAGFLKNRLIRRPPFRDPHHTISDAGMVGGGKNLLPGELSLAHNGVLFLDEFPEFKRNVLEALREPLESGCVALSRANGILRYPARIQLVAAMNPCPCGFAGADERFCKCTPVQIRNYAKRISGPLLDRLDLRVHLPMVSRQEFFQTETAETIDSAGVREKVRKVREIQNHRFKDQTFCQNANIPPEAMERFCPLEKAAKEILSDYFQRWAISTRGIHRIMRVARTLADLELASPEKPVSAKALFQALNFWQIKSLL